MKQTILFLIGITFLVAGCDKDSKVAEAPRVAYLMVYNGSPDFYGITGLVLKNNQPYGGRTYNDNGDGLVGAYNFSSYSFIDTGWYRMAFLDSSSIPEKGAKLSETRVRFEDNKHYTLYLLDSLGYFEVLTTEDDVPRDPAKATIRLLHLSPDAGDVFLRIDTERIDGIQPVTFRGVSPFVTVNPDIKPGIRVMYLDAETGEEKTLTRKSFPLEAGKCYTMILRGYKKAPDGNVNKTINLSTITNF